MPMQPNNVIVHGVPDFYATRILLRSLPLLRFSLPPILLRSHGCSPGSVDAYEKAPEIGLLVAQPLTAVERYEDAAQVLRAFLRDHGDRREAMTARRWLERLTASAKIRAN
jgi:hypothetical protein